MSLAHLNNSTYDSDSDPLQLEVESEVIVEDESEVIVEDYSEEATSTEVFTKEESSSSCSPEAAEPAVDSQDVDIEPQDAVKIEFNDDTSANANASHTVPNYCTAPVRKWPLLEIIPGGFVCNNTTLDEDFTTPVTVHTSSNIKRNDPPQIDIPKYVLMGREETYSEEAVKMYSCAKCDDSFDVMLDLTKHLKTHLPKRMKTQNEIKWEESIKKNDELLILCVRAQRCLWDKSVPEYEDIEVKEDAWREVIKQCRIVNVNHAKEKWKNLRTRHRSILKREKSKLGETSEPWMYTELMQFLLPSYKKRKPPEDEEERLIKSIRARPCLWDAAPCRGQRKERRERRRVKERAWLDVVNESNICDVMTAKNKWNNLRNIHRDILKQMRSEGAPDVKWKYASSMQFLPPYRQNKKRQS